MRKGHKKKLLNLGCGKRFNAEWTNLDFASPDINVIKYNLNYGIPYPDNYFDIVYHSHILEHFTKNDAEKFIKECHRVLVPGGIIRIAVPDLEQICKNYITFLESADKGNCAAEANYDWTMMEMYDQCVRLESGGEMKNYFNNNILNKDFIRKRIGYFYDIASNPTMTTWKKRIKKILSQETIDSIKKILKSICYLLPGEKYRRLGRFRMSGEIHQWMYDRFSLKRLLSKHGFEHIITRTASDSYVENWTKYNLDTEPDGTIYKADSVYIEAKK